MSNCQTNQQTFTKVDLQCFQSIHPCSPLFALHTCSHQSPWTPQKASQTYHAIYFVQRLVQCHFQACLGAVELFPDHLQCMPGPRWRLYPT